MAVIWIKFFIFRARENVPQGVWRKQPAVGIFS